MNVGDIVQVNPEVETRTASLIESVFNVLIGYGVALAIGAWFTIISLVRSYAIRRWFNARLHRAAQKIAGL
jgi:hypothetical protein